jgi:hypothetical protein
MGLAINCGKIAISSLVSRYAESEFRVGASAPTHMGNAMLWRAGSKGMLAAYNTGFLRDVWLLMN